ncbi:hypothetical protein Dimus_016995 [Dionaea muscipula]
MAAPEEETVQFLFGENEDVQVVNLVYDLVWYRVLGQLSGNSTEIGCGVDENDENSKVPKFGAWDGEEAVAYTMYFDHARKNKNQGQMKNPNEPQPNRDSPHQNSDARADQVTQENENLRKPDASLSHQENKGRGSTNQQVNEQTGGRLPIEPRQKQAMQSVGSDASIERSPLHSRAVGRGGGGPPSFDGKNSFDSAHGTPGRSRPRAGSQTPDRGPSVPEFGAWNTDPAQADGYTDVFERVGKAKKGEATPNNGRPSYAGHRKDETKVYIYG